MKDIEAATMHVEFEQSQVWMLNVFGVDKGANSVVCLVGSLGNNVVSLAQ